MAFDVEFKAIFKLNYYLRLHQTFCLSIFSNTGQSEDEKLLNVQSASACALARVRASAVTETASGLDRSSSLKISFLLSSLTCNDFKEATYVDFVLAKNLVRAL